MVVFIYICDRETKQGDVVKARQISRLSLILFFRVDFCTYDMLSYLELIAVHILLITEPMLLPAYAVAQFATAKSRNEFLHALKLLLLPSLDVDDAEVGQLTLLQANQTVGTKKKLIRTSTV